MKKNATKTPAKKSSTTKASKLPKLSQEQLKQISGGATNVPVKGQATY